MEQWREGGRDRPDLRRGGPTPAATTQDRAPGCGTTDLIQWCALHADVLSPSLLAAPSLSFSAASLSHALLLVGNFPRRDLLAGGVRDPA
jgi:hypothetical protein